MHVLVVLLSVLLILCYHRDLRHGSRSREKRVYKGKRLLLHFAHKRAHKEPHTLRERPLAFPFLTKLLQGSVFTCVREHVHERRSFMLVCVCLRKSADGRELFMNTVFMNSS